MRKSRTIADHGRKISPRAYTAFAAAAVLILLLLPGCPYYKPAFRGMVIDSETEEPVEGAAVAVEYNREMACLCCIPLWPVGGSCQEMNVRETLTDEKGMFYIPCYPTLMFPYSMGCYTQFVIFRPGYGTFPKHHSFRSPPFYVGDAEKFFSEDFGESGTVRYEKNGETEIVPVTFGVVKLPRVKTWEEREEAASFSLPDRSFLLRGMRDREYEYHKKNRPVRGRSEIRSGAFPGKIPHENPDLKPEPDRHGLGEVMEPSLNYENPDLKPESGRPHMPKRKGE